MAALGRIMAMAAAVLLAGFVLGADKAPAGQAEPIRVGRGVGSGGEFLDQKPPCQECEKQRRMHPERYPQASQSERREYSPKNRGNGYQKPCDSRKGHGKKQIKHVPPPWAPAHGRKARYMYRYYPRSRVYYDPGRKMWFWPAGGKWRSGPSLPGSLRLDISGMVRLGMDVDRPYTWQSQVGKFFPPPGVR